MFSTNLKPNTQSFLFGYDNLFRDMVKLYENKKLPNKILFSGLKGIGKATFAYHLINYIFSKNEEIKYVPNMFLLWNFTYGQVSEVLKKFSYDI